MRPATQNAEDTLRRPAPLVVVEVPLAVEPEAVVVAELEEPRVVPAAVVPAAVVPAAVVPAAVVPAAVVPELAVEAPEALVPLGWAELLMQLVELPAWIVTMLEYAIAPVLSFKEIELHKVMSMGPMTT